MYDSEALKLTDEQRIVADALDSTLGTWSPNEAIRIRGMRYPHGFSELGREIDESLAEWVDWRKQHTAKLLPSHSSGKVEARKRLQPLELGVLVEKRPDGLGGRQKADVVAKTWIALDSDSGQSPSRLRQVLEALQVAFAIAESTSSRLAAANWKWHCFIPLAEPKMLADRGTPGVADVETAEASARWWERVHNHVARQFFLLGGIDYAADGDKTSDRLVQGNYVPHRPDGGGTRLLKHPDKGGRLLDLDKFLRETGFDEVDPPVVRLEDIERPAARQPRPDGGGDDGGDTVGESTGSLVYAALDAFRLVGPKHRSKDAYFVLCPWRHLHASSVEAGTTEEYSDATMVFMSEKGGKPGGGLSCFHSGCCAAASGGRIAAADVLAWARKMGAPLPNRQGWGGDTTLVGPPRPADAAPRLPETPAIAFALAPDLDAEIVPPAAATARLPRRDERRVIEIDEDDLAGMIERAIAALAGTPEADESAPTPGHPLYYKARTGDGYRLVDLLEAEGRAPSARVAKLSTLTPEIQKVAKWVGGPRSKDDMNPETRRGVMPPAKVLASVLDAGSYPGVRELRGIVTTPLFHPDGVVVQTPGYNESLGVVYHPTGRVPAVSADPSYTALVAAKSLLLEVLEFFPFERGREDLCRGVWLAGVFTRLLRTVYRGNVPFFLVSSGDRSSGKGKAIDAAALITDGVTSSTVNFSASEDENARIIGMMLAGGAPVVHVDNIRGALKSTSYESFATTPTWMTREIGSSKGVKKQKSEINGLADSQMWFSGINLATGGDISRRSLRIDIMDTTGAAADRKVPTEKQGLTPWVEANRPRLLAAALTLCAGFFAARRRGYKVELPAFASFEGWSICREVVVWMGLPDPMLARGRAEDDETDANFGHLINHLRVMGVAEGEVLQQDICKILVEDATKKKDRKHLSFYSFLIDEQVKLKDVETATQSLGGYLKGYVGRTLKTADGRRWRIDKRRTEGGAALKLNEQMD